jgi:hypothetical protein
MPVIAHALLCSLALAAGAEPSAPPPAAAVAASTSARVASFFLSQDLINGLLQRGMKKSTYLKDMRIELVPKQGEIVLLGTLSIPAEELLAMNLDPHIGAFKFRLTIQPKTTRHGHLILVFPLEQTYFWPADVADPAKERVIVPVQLMSLALASARGYLAAVSGDYSGFERRERRLKEQIAALVKERDSTKDSAERDALRDQQKSVQLQLDALPLERRQLKALGKEVESLLGFSGEKEMNLNNELAAHKNALVLKLRLGQLVPYMKDIDLDGVRILRDEKDGEGENFLGIDIAAALDKPLPVRKAAKREHKPAAHAPDVVIKLDQALLESDDVLGAEKADMSSRVKDLKLELLEDGLRATGKWYSPLLVHLPFEALVDFVWVGPNQFELRVRDVKVSFLDVTVLARLILDAAKGRMERSLKGVCRFDYAEREKGFTRVLRATVDMPKLLPALPGLTLTDVDTRDGALVLKAGRL